MDKTAVMNAYGALLVLGGTIGFLRKQSLPSLLAGGGTGLTVLALTNLQGGVESNKALLQIIAGLLFIGMAFRTFKSGKFMPPGLVAVISALALGAVSQ